MLARHNCDYLHSSGGRERRIVSSRRVQLLGPHVVLLGSLDPNMEELVRTPALTSTPALARRSSSDRLCCGPGTHEDGMDQEPYPIRISSLCSMEMDP